MSKNPDTDPLYDNCFTKHKLDKKGEWIINQYDCKYCSKCWMFPIWGWKSEVVNVHDGYSEDGWAKGLPQTIRQCTLCKKWDGHWIDSCYRDG